MTPRAVIGASSGSPMHFHPPPRSSSGPNDGQRPQVSSSPSWFPAIHQLGRPPPLVPNTRVQPDPSPPSGANPYSSSSLGPNMRDQPGSSPPQGANRRLTAPPLVDQPRS